MVDNNNINGSHVKIGARCATGVVVNHKDTRKTIDVIYDCDGKKRTYPPHMLSSLLPDSPIMKMVDEIEKLKEEIKSLKRSDKKMYELLLQEQESHSKTLNNVFKNSNLTEHHCKQAELHANEFNKADSPEGHYRTLIGDWYLMCIKEENDKLKKWNKDIALQVKNHHDNWDLAMKNEKELKEQADQLKKLNTSLQYEYFDKTGENYDPKFDGIWSKSEDMEELQEKNKALGFRVDALSQAVAAFALEGKKLKKENKELKEYQKEVKIHLAFEEEMEELQEENEKLKEENEELKASQ